MRVVLDLDDDECLALYQIIDAGVVDAALKDRGWPAGQASAFGRAFDKLETAICDAMEVKRAESASPPD